MCLLQKTILEKGLTLLYQIQRYVKANIHTTTHTQIAPIWETAHYTSHFNNILTTLLEIETRVKQP